MILNSYNTFLSLSSASNNILDTLISATNFIKKIPKFLEDSIVKSLDNIISAISMAIFVACFGIKKVLQTLGMNNTFSSMLAAIPGIMSHTSLFFLSLALTGKLALYILVLTFINPPFMIALLFSNFAAIEAISFVIMAAKIFGVGFFMSITLSNIDVLYTRLQGSELFAADLETRTKITDRTRIIKEYVYLAAQAVKFPFTAPVSAIAYLTKKLYQISPWGRRARAEAIGLIRVANPYASEEELHSILAIQEQEQQNTQRRAEALLLFNSTETPMQRATLTQDEQSKIINLEQELELALSKNNLTSAYTYFNLEIQYQVNLGVRYQDILTLHNQSNKYAPEKFWEGITREKLDDANTNNPHLCSIISLEFMSIPVYLIKPNNSRTYMDFFETIRLLYEKPINPETRELLTINKLIYDKGIHEEIIMLRDDLKNTNEITASPLDSATTNTSPTLLFGSQTPQTTQDRLNPHTTSQARHRPSFSG